jgi:hypothetical protein
LPDQEGDLTSDGNIQLVGLEWPTCKERMKVIARVTEPKSVARCLVGIGEFAEVPGRSSGRRPRVAVRVLLETLEPLQVEMLQRHR